MVCILCKISHRHHPSRHHHRRRPIYDACISCIFCDDICRDGHNTNNNVCANICYGNQSCHIIKRIVVMASRSDTNFNQDTIPFPIAFIIMADVTHVFAGSPCYFKG